MSLEIDYSISRIARETGISKDVLRMWERRYGFPKPSRTAGQERMYTPEELERLKLIKRLTDIGHRPGQLIVLPNAQLEAMLDVPEPTQTDQSALHKELNRIIELMCSGDMVYLSQYLSYWQHRYGMQAFVLQLLPSLLKMVGDYWQSGRISIHQEHLLTEMLQTQLRQSFAAWLAPTRTERVLLTTLPNEQHGLSLLMAEHLLRMDGWTTVNLGTQMPVEDIVKACIDYQITFLCLSLSEANAGTVVQNTLLLLDRALPDHVHVWLGGSGVVGLKLKSKRFEIHRHFDSLLSKERC